MKGLTAFFLLFFLPLESISEVPHTVPIYPIQVEVEAASRFAAPLIRVSKEAMDRITGHTRRKRAREKARQAERVQNEPALYDDSQMKLTGEKETTEDLRRKLVEYIWKNRGFPTDKTPVIEAEVKSPVANIENLEAVDRLTIKMPLADDECGGGILRSVAYHFKPKKANGRLVVVHQGHSATADLESFGVGDAIRSLVQKGFTVVALQMPANGENEAPPKCPTHNDMIEKMDTASRSGFQFFMEPIAVALNYLESKSTFSDISMVGISGGGWSATLYAALDPRIKTSLPVAGSLPLYLRVGSSRGDHEQNYPGLYSIAGYKDLYAMAADRPGRKQIQILNYYDSCCFFGPGYLRYEKEVGAMAKKLGGHFEVYSDTSLKQDHKISSHALAFPILEALQ